MIREKFILLVFNVMLLVKRHSTAVKEQKISKYNETHDQFITRLLTGYNKSLRPGLEAETTDTIEISMHVISISDIDTDHMEYTLGVVMYQFWEDERLKYSDAYDKPLTMSYHFDQIWTPDTFFRNGKKGTVHNVSQDNIYLRVTPDGKLVLALKISTTLSCHMDLKYFPHDIQYCSAQISSFGYRKNELKYKWHSTGVVVNPDLELPEFELTNVETSECHHQSVTGWFTCIQAKFTFDRDIGHYLIQMFIPTIIFVLLSFLNFYFDPKAVPARVALGLLAVLAITTKHSSAVTTLPKVSYVKAVDIWMSVCLVFVLLAFAEYCVVHYILFFYELPYEKEAPKKVEPPAPDTGQEATEQARGQEGTAAYINPAFEQPKNVWTDQEHHRAPTNSVQQKPTAKEADTTQERTLTLKQRLNEVLWRKRPLSAKIDFWSRLMFPFIFGVFVLFYWIKYPLGI